MITSKVKSFFLSYGKLILFTIAIVFIVIYAKKKTAHTEKNGVITVAKILKYEPAESGSSLKINIYLKDKVITTSVGTGCYFCVGGYYFIKVIKDDPASYPLLLLDKPVPDCIIENIKYYQGWDSFPTCYDIQTKRLVF
jgi:hypothetical protein